jgi:hypothetical protein
MRLVDVIECILDIPLIPAPSPKELEITIKLVHMVVKIGNPTKDRWSIKGA